MKPKIENQEMYQKMLQRLDMMYERENEIQNEIELLRTEWKQLQEDKELCQYMIMHYVNKQVRKSNISKLLK